MKKTMFIFVLVTLLELAFLEIILSFIYRNDLPIPYVIIWQLNPHDYANLAYGPVLYDINRQSQLVPIKGNLTATY